ncbi:MAG: hypothetical protein AABO58_06135 [Acidobacteriota bacterium]
MRTALMLLLVAATAHAHPSVSVVIDSHGNVYYSDLAQVWRVATDGAKSVVVPNVHTHELYLDAQDNLSGEHLWYEGEATKKWGHYFWRRTAAGSVERIMPAHEPFKNEDDVSFVRDRAGNQYWADRKNNAIMKRTPAGQKSVLARGKFGDVRWMTASPEGVIYFVDTLDLLRVTPDGRMSVLARGISTKNLVDLGPAHHQIMGLWTDRAGNVYAADNKNNVVKRIAKDGTITIIARSALPWSVTGGTFAPNGDLWLLEYAMYDARVRRIDGSRLPLTVGR